MNQYTPYAPENQPRGLNQDAVNQDAVIASAFCEAIYLARDCHAQPRRGPKGGLHRGTFGGAFGGAFGATGATGAAPRNDAGFCG